MILSDYAKGALTPRLCRSVIEAGRRHNIPVLVDPKSPDFSIYAGATTACPNLHELSLATGIPTHRTDEILAAGRLLAEQCGFDFLTVTRSERVIILLEPSVIYTSPARARA